MQIPRRPWAHHNNNRNDSIETVPKIQVQKILQQNDLKEIEKKKCALRSLKKEFKKLLLLKDGKKFYQSVTKALLTVSSSDVAKILYDIFISANKKISYLEKFNQFLQPLKKFDTPLSEVQKKDGKHFLKNFLKEVSDLKILTYLLNNTLLYLPEEYYSKENKAFFDFYFSGLNFFHKDFFYRSRYNSSNQYFGKKSFFVLRSIAKVSPSFLEENQKKLICSLKKVMLAGLKEESSKYTHKYKRPTLIELVFPIEENQFQKFKDWINITTMDPFVIKDFFKIFCEEFQLFHLFAKTSKLFNFKVESLCMTVSYFSPDKPLLHIFLKTKPNLEGDPRLEFFREKDQLEQALRKFYKDSNFEELNEVFLHLTIQEKDIAEIVIHYFQSCNDELERLGWKQFIKTSEYFQKKIKYIYNILPYTSKEDLQRKEDFLKTFFFCEDPFFKKINASS